MDPLWNLQRRQQRKPAAERIPHQVELLDSEARHRLSHRPPEILYGLRALIGGRVAEAGYFEQDDTMIARQKLVRAIQPESAGAMKVNDGLTVAGFEVTDAKAVRLYESLAKVGCSSVSCSRGFNRHS